MYDFGANFKMIPQNLRSFNFVSVMGSWGLQNHQREGTASGLDSPICRSLDTTCPQSDKDCKHESCHGQ